MSDLDRLLNAFTNKKKRWESDCAIIGKVVDFCLSTNDANKKAGIKWLLRLMESKKTKPVARQKIYLLLSHNSDILTKKQQKRLSRFKEKEERGSRKIEYKG